LPQRRPRACIREADRFLEKIRFLDILDPSQHCHTITVPKQRLLIFTSTNCFWSEDALGIVSGLPVNKTS
jgi:hypothetical protein